MTAIASNLAQVRARIHQCCQRFGRASDSVALLAVSKTCSAQTVLDAAAAGQRAFGENYVQEALDKIEQLRRWGAPDLQWHCIGPVQSNKTRWVAESFAWMHTLERSKIAQRLSEQRPAHLPPLQVCLQVNVDAGPNKSGVAPAALLALAHEVARLPRLQLRGLMCIPEPAPDFDTARATFAQAQQLLLQLQQSGLAVDTLSMGMSADLEAAIAAGSTWVRVGSAIFGARPAAAAPGCVPSLGAR